MYKGREKEPLAHLRRVTSEGSVHIYSSSWKARSGTFARGVLGQMRKRMLNWVCKKRRALAVRTPLALSAVAVSGIWFSTSFGMSRLKAIFGA